MATPTAILSCENSERFDRSYESSDQDNVREYSQCRARSHLGYEKNEKAKVGIEI